MTKETEGKSKREQFYEDLNNFHVGSGRNVVEMLNLTMQVVKKVSQILG